MVKLSAFADEISDNFEEEISALKENNVGAIELRSVNGKNVLSLSSDEIKEIKKKADDAGIAFSAVGSPLGKFPLDGNFQEQLDALKTALEYAEYLKAPYIRIFSFFIPDDKTPAECRSQVMDWLGQMSEEAEKTKTVLAHENEKNIYGDTGERCLDIYKTIQSPSFTGIFDFANFVECEQDTYNDCWVKIRDFISYFHIKDAVSESKKIVPAGQGDGQIEKILREAIQNGFDNYLSLEPHLSTAAASYGKTSPELFRTAVTALNKTLDQLT